MKNKENQRKTRKTLGTLGKPTEKHGKPMENKGNEGKPIKNKEKGEENAGKPMTKQGHMKEKEWTSKQGTLWKTLEHERKIKGRLWETQGKASQNEKHKKSKLNPGPFWMYLRPIFEEDDPATTSDKPTTSTTLTTTLAPYVRRRRDWKPEPKDVPLIVVEWCELYVFSKRICNIQVRVWNSN